MGRESKLSITDVAALAETAPKGGRVTGDLNSVELADPQVPHVRHLDRRNADSTAKVSLVLSSDNKIVHASDDFCHLLGYRREKLIGRSPLDFTHPDDVEASRHLMQHSHRRPGKPTVLEKRFITSDGEVVAVRVTALWHPSTETIVANVTDITEITALRRRHNVMIESSADAILVIDRDWVVTDLNQAAREMVGSVGTNLWELLAMAVHPDDLVATFAAIEHAHKTPGFHRPITFRASIDSGIWYHYSATVNNQLDDPAIRGIVINGRNVTAQVEQVTALRETERAMGRALIEISELSDPYTAGHQRHVADLAERIASRMSLDPRSIADIVLAASLHDIGKAGVPAAILSKLGPLTCDDLLTLRSHCEIGHRILTNGGMSQAVTDPVRHHHERLDGSGYPDGLVGEQITLASRIVAVADVIDAISSDRPYRPSLGLGAAIQEVTAKRCRLYDPDVVDAALDVIESAQTPAADASFFSPG